MTTDTKAPYGHYIPSLHIRRVISLAQRAPNNVVGRQLAKFIRAKVKRQTQPPLDLEIEGMKLRCHLWDNYTERKLVFMPWRFDVQERRMILSVLPADGVFVDIGANVGVYSLIAATHMNANGRVLALEPYPPIYSRLCFNIEATRQGRAEWPAVVALPIGVADKLTELELHLNPDNLGENSVCPDIKAGGSEQTVLVQCKPLLDILQEQSIERIDVLKIDIEGAEDMALCPFLADAPDNLLPRYILIENSEARWQRDLNGDISGRGYRPVMQSRMNTIYQLARA